MRGGGTATKRRYSYRTRISQSLGFTVGQPSDHDQSDSKRSKRSPAPSSEVISIDDLPDVMLVEIFCLLPRESAVQCMLVSKRWFALISDPQFTHRRFLSFQREEQEPIRRTLIFSDVTEEKTNCFSIQEQYTGMKDRRPLSLSFLPCCQATGDEPLVVGTYDDLICCCSIRTYQREYYICNPYTKQWVALPLPPRFHKEVRVGFVCIPYDKHCMEDGERQEETSITSSNVEYYRYKVVQIIVPKDSGTNSSEFKVQIFSSKTRKWTESSASIALCPQNLSVESLSNDAGVAHNGMLYWSGQDFIMVLDPCSNSETTITGASTTITTATYCCPYIYKPIRTFEVTSDFIRVCRGGQLRTCRLFEWHQFGRTCTRISIWEFNDYHLVRSWREVDSVNLDHIVSKNPLMAKWELQRHWRNTIKLQDFDPNDEDILYMEMFQHLVMYNIQTRTLKEVTTLPFKSCAGRRAFQFGIPWWPTPVTKLL